MTEDKKVEDFVKLKTSDVIDSAKSLMAASSILTAASDQYAHTGILSVGAVVHAGNVIDHVIEKLGMADLIIDQDMLPF